VRVAAYQAPLLPSGSTEVAVRLIRERVERCESEGVEILCCPEGVLGGLADYAHLPIAFAIDVERGQLDAVLAPLASDRVTTIVGFTESAPRGRLYNAAAILQGGSVVGVYRKLYPAINRSVYAPGNRMPVFTRGTRIRRIIGDCRPKWGRARVCATPRGRFGCCGHRDPTARPADSENHQERKVTSRRSIISLGVGAIPAVAFAVHDLVLQLPDNQHEASLGFFVTASGLLFVWGLLGYLAARGRPTAVAAIGAGAIAGLMSVGVLWLTFITLNNLFTDRMSYEPDRVRAFMASGYPTMKAYVKHGLGVGPFPLLMGVAALAGMAGGARAHRTCGRSMK